MMNYGKIHITAASLPVMVKLAMANRYTIDTAVVFRLIVGYTSSLVVVPAS